MILGTPVSFTQRVHEYGDVFSLFFRARSGEKSFAHRAGEYVHIHVGGLPSPQSIRELSFASAPHEDDICFTVHLGSGSSVKRRLEQLSAGEEIGLFRTGSHSEPPTEVDSRPRVLIGAGVGMAPLRSLALHMGHAMNAGPEVHVVQVQRVDADGYLYRQDFEDAASTYRPISPEELASVLEHAVGERPDAQYHVGGSTRFVAAARTRLLSSGVDREALTSEQWG